MTLREDSGVIECSFLGFECSIFIYHLTVLLSNDKYAIFGELALDGPLQDRNGIFVKRVGSVYGCESIVRILEVTEKNCWEDLEGSEIRVKIDDTTGSIESIGHTDKDQWFDPYDLRKEVDSR